MGKLWCEIEDELSSLKNAQRRGGESDRLFGLRNEISPLFLSCNGFVHSSSNGPLNCKSNADPEAVRRIVKTTKPPSITPHLCTNWPNITSTLYFIPFLTLHNPERCTRTVTWALPWYCNSPRQELCLFSCVWVCVCVCVYRVGSGGLRNSVRP